nr:uncharacterized protein LOC129276002 [Lytechinus pictus]
MGGFWITSKIVFAIRRRRALFDTKPCKLEKRSKFFHTNGPGVNEEQEGGEDVESHDHEETEKGHGYTQPLNGYLLDTKILTININAPDRTEVSQDDKEFQEQEIRAKHEFEEEPEKHLIITSWEYDADKDTTILDLVQSKMPLTEVLFFVAKHCPKLQDLRLHANVPEFVSIGDLQSRSKDFGYESEEKDLPELRVYIRFRHQTTSISFDGLLMIMSSVFPNISDLKFDGGDETELRLQNCMFLPKMPKWHLLPKVRTLTLEQFWGSFSLLMLLKLVILHLSNLPLLRIIRCNVGLDVQMGSEIMKTFPESDLRYLEINPVNDIPFSSLYELVFKVCNNCLNTLNNFIVHNVKATHNSFKLLKWTKTRHELYLKQSLPLKDFEDFMSIVKNFPYIRKLEADECGSFERPDILKIVSTCSSLQYFSSVANGKRSTLAISDHNLMMRESASEQISKSFGRLGGELILEKYGVTLNVPEGAIEREGEIDIGLQVLTNPPSTHLQEDDEMVCSFGFRCTIPKLPGLKFAKPVKVTVPHSAILEVHPSEVHVGMYSGELWHDTGDVEISTISYNWPSKGSLPRCELGTNEISVFIEHFSFGWPFLKIRNLFNRKKHVRGKRMGCLSFVPIQMPPTRKPVLRVQLFDYLKGNPENRYKGML